ncbi:MAG TPA: hypothetical protein VI455_01200, partial [Terriglobia bacterium]
MENTALRKAHLKFIVCCLLPWLVAASLGAQDQGSPPGRVARLSFTQGNVSFQPSGESQWSTAS